MFNFVTDTSSWAYFKENFVLIKTLNTYMTLKWLLCIIYPVPLHQKSKKVY